MLGVGGAEILEQPVVASGQRGESIHRALDDRRDHRVEGVRSLDPGRRRRVLCDARTTGRSGSSARARCANTSSSSIIVTSSSERTSILLTSCDVRNPSKKCTNGMRDANVALCATRREVVRFLHRARTEHRPAGHPGGHDVGVIAEDRERLRGHAPRPRRERPSASARRRS